MNDQGHTKTTTVGGTATILLTNIASEDVIKTIVMAVLGATVSFVMSQVLKKIVKWLKTRKG